MASLKRAPAETPHSANHWFLIGQIYRSVRNLCLHVIIRPADNGIPINVLLRTARIDGGSLDYKAMARAVLVGDNETGTAVIRWSDDDMQTQVPYRPVDLADEEPMIRRMGRFRRRTLETGYVEDDPLNLVAMEVETA